MSKIPLSQFQALASQPRLEILRYLASSSRYCDLAEKYPFSGNYLQALQHKMNLSKATLSHHISVLQSAKLVKSVKHGRIQLLFIATEGFELIKDYIGVFGLSSHDEAKPLTVFKIHKLDSTTIKVLLDYVHLHGWKVSNRIMLPDPLSERYYLLWEESPLLRLQFDIRSSQLLIQQLGNHSEHNDRIQPVLKLLDKAKICYNPNF